MAHSQQKDRSTDYTKRILTDSPEELYDVLIKSMMKSPDFIYVLDLQKGKVILVNRDEFWGYTREECEEPGSLLHAVHPEDIKNVTENWSLIFEGAECRSIEYRLKRKGEDYHWVLQRCIVLSKDEKGEPCKLMVILSDLEQLKQTEKALLESEQQLSDIFDTMTEGVALNEMVLNETGEMIDYRILKVNRAFYNIADYEGTNVIGNLATKIYGMSSDFIRDFWNLHKTRSTSGITEMVSHLSNRTYSISTSPFKDNRFVTVFSDITVQKEERQRLAESEFRFRSVFENSKDGMMITVPNGSIQLANPAACKIFGMTEEELCSAGRKGIVDLSDERLPLILEERKKTGKASGELRHRRKDGSVFPAEVATNIFFGPDGKEMTITLIRDITERRCLIDHLKKAKDFAEALIETANIIFVQLDKKGSIARVNTALEKVTGYRKEELIGENWFDTIVPRKIYPYVWEKFVNVTSQGEFPKTFENPILTKEGAEKQILWSNSTLYEEGKVKSTISFGFDITDHRKKDSALRETQFWLEAVLSNAPVTLFATDEEGVFTLSDGRELEKVGLKPGENVGVSAYDLYGSTTFKDSSGHTISGKELIDRALKGETLLVGNELSGINFHNYIGPIIDDSGNIKGIVGVATDISEQKKLEKILREKEANIRALTEHLTEIMETERSLIAHDLHDDLGQKLTAMNLGLNWLKSRIGVQSGAVINKIKELSCLLIDSVESIKRITYRLRPSVLDNLGLKAAIEWQVSDFIRNTGIKTDLRFRHWEITADNEISLTVFRVIQEALTNISRHSGATAVVIEISSKDDELKIFISDNGCGIKIKESDSNRSFGLMGMKERALMHNGEIMIKGKKNKGTTVSIRLPLKYKTQ